MSSNSRILITTISKPRVSPRIWRIRIGEPTAEELARVISPPRIFFK
jgi:hypothetical protein